jgi:hypothetical protein
MAEGRLIMLLQSAVLRATHDSGYIPQKALKSWPYCAIPTRTVVLFLGFAHLALCAAVLQIIGQTNGSLKEFPGRFRS